MVTGVENEKNRKRSCSSLNAKQTTNKKGNGRMNRIAVAEA